MRGTRPGTSLERAGVYHDVMDTDLSVLEVAGRLGVPPSRVLAALRTDAVPAHKDRRGRWRVPMSSVERLERRWGGVPALCDELDRPAMLVLAALTRRPRGLPSARAAAVAAGVSPTTAAARLHGLQAAGLAEQRHEHRILRGSATPTRVWHARWGAPGWHERLQALAQVRLPDRQPSSATPQSLPDHVWQLVWNADPHTIDVQRDAVFLAGRVLDLADPETEAWAQRTLPAHAWAQAAKQRGRSNRQRATAAAMARTSSG